MIAIEYKLKKKRIVVLYIGNDFNKTTNIIIVAVESIIRDVHSN